MENIKNDIFHSSIELETTINQDGDENIFMTYISSTRNNNILMTYIYIHQKQQHINQISVIIHMPQKAFGSSEVSIAYNDHAKLIH